MGELPGECAAQRPPACGADIPRVDYPMNDALVSSRSRSWARGVSALLVLALVAPAIPVSAQVKATTGYTLAPQSSSTPTALPLQLQINLKLSALHPAATQGGLQCGAVAQTRAWVDAHRALLTDYDALSRWVLAGAHYAGQQAALSFAITNRSYTGTQTFTTTLTPPAQTDPATHARFAPDPTVWVACWLMLNGRPARWDQGSGLEVVSATNFSTVAGSPLVTATADASTGAAINLSAALTVNGAFFSPAAVNVTVNLSAGAVAAGAATTGATGVRPPGPPTAQIAALASPPAGSASAVTSASLNTSARSALVNTAQPSAAASVSTNPSTQSGPMSPQPMTLQASLSATGGFLVPAPQSVTASMTASGGFLVPAPLTVSGSMQASGAFLTPAPISINQSFSASGNFLPPSQQ